MAGTPSEKPPGVSLHQCSPQLYAAAHAGHRARVANKLHLTLSTLLLCRYIPAGVSAEKLAEIERWRCDSRTAACACLLLLCATRETLAQGAEALQLARALTEVCAALGRHSGQDSMAWGCDLDPGNLGAHMSALAGTALCSVISALCPVAP